MKLPALLLLIAASAAPAATLDVDLSEAPRRLIHSRLVLPAQPGRLTLAYPKWIPGEHSPTGPLVDVGGLVIRAQGKALAWRRDPVELYRVELEVPQGAHEIEVALDYISPPPGQGHFTSGASVTQNLAVLAWNSVLVYPDGAPARSIPVRASIKLPRGWKFATALSAAGQDGDTVRFKEVSLEQLVDSPLLAGAHMTELALGENRGAPVVLSVAAETDEELQIPPQSLEQLRQLVREEAALFQARHFDRYRFLLALTDSVPSNGIEHHESSDNRLGGRAFLDRELTLSGLVHLLAHESTHSWNGKYRRPASLTTPDFGAPQKGDLLWVYEGLTQYLGTVLTARSGAWNPEALRDYFALVADEQQSRVGRRWRPVQDTATAAQILYGARDDWESLRRRVDFYPEGDLIWLEVDARLRESSGGKVSLDDFCKRFHGGGDSGPKVSTYTFEDVARTLEELAPGGRFAELLRARLDATGDQAPLEGLARAGYKLDYADTQTELQRARDKDNKRIDLRSSIGLVLESEQPVIADVIPGRPADKAGVMPGTKLVAVNGRRYTPERLFAAVAATKASHKLELLVENADTYRTFTLDYASGHRFPRLTRVEGRPDLLAQIGAPKGAAP